MTRTGKIARLPREIREQLNRRLDDGETGKTLVGWLNSLPEVQAVLKTEFDERPISKQNLSEWKTGGYRDWVLQQETIELVRHMDADSDELSQASKIRLTDLLAQRLAARYVLVARKLNQPNGDGELDPKLLRELCGDIVALRKGDHSAERLQLERERLEFDRQQLQPRLEKMFMEWAQQPENKARICGRLSYEEKRRRIAEIFGISVEDMPHEPEDEISSETVPDATPAAPTESNQIKPDQAK
jgi:hypothetical protein